mmetsp:Transcript_36238/g.103992  ORF Transcript_36238/g.103992 Transcript_36238/m.103992 type:complete len:192 (+) Transcript_36238:458-1033(+)
MEGGVLGEGWEAALSDAESSNQPDQYRILREMYAVFRSLEGSMFRFLAQHNPSPPPIVVIRPSKSHEGPFALPLRVGPAPSSPRSRLDPSSRSSLSLTHSPLQVLLCPPPTHSPLRVLLCPLLTHPHCLRGRPRISTGETSRTTHRQQRRCHSSMPHRRQWSSMRRRWHTWKREWRVWGEYFACLLVFLTR